GFPSRSSNSAGTSQDEIPGPVAMACQTSSGVPGTSTSTWTDRRPDGSFFTLMLAPLYWTSASSHGPGRVAFAHLRDRVKQHTERSAVHRQAPLPILRSTIAPHYFTVLLQCIKLHPNVVGGSLGAYVNREIITRFQRGNDCLSRD